MLTQLISMLGLGPDQQAKGVPADPKGEEDFTDIFADLEQDRESLPEPAVAVTPAEPDVETADLDESKAIEAELEEWLSSLRSAREEADASGPRMIEVTSGAHQVKPDPQVGAGVNAPENGRRPHLGAGAMSEKPTSGDAIEIAQAPILTRLFGTNNDAAESNAVDADQTTLVRETSLAQLTQRPERAVGPDSRDLPIFAARELTPWRPQTALADKVVQAVAEPGRAPGDRAGISLALDWADEPTDLPEVTAFNRPTDNRIRIVSDRFAAAMTASRPSLSELATRMEPETSVPKPAAGIAEHFSGARNGTSMPMADLDIPDELNATITSRFAAESRSLLQDVSDVSNDIPEDTELSTVIPVFRSPRAQRAAQALAVPSSVDHADSVADAPFDLPMPEKWSTTTDVRSDASRINGTMPKPDLSAQASNSVASSGGAASLFAPAVLDSSEDPTDSLDMIVSSGEARTTSATLAPNGMSPSRADVPHAMRQIAEALPRLSDGRIEIRLDPEELGRVRMQLVTHDGALTVQIQADRPETLDLMRRHIDQLARDLADAGYEGATFDFGEGDQQSHQKGGQHSASVDSPEETPLPKPAMTAADGGLDILI